MSSESPKSKIKPDDLIDALYKVPRLLSVASSLDSAVPQVAQILRAFIEWDLVALWTRDGELEFRCENVWSAPGVTATHLKEKTRAFRFKHGEGLPGSVVARREPIIVTDLARESGFLRAAEAKKDGINSGAWFPLMYNDKVVGILELLCKSDCSPNVEAGGLLATLGLLLGQFVDHHSFDSELKRAERALKAAYTELEHRFEQRTTELGSVEQHLKLLIEGVTDYAMYVLDPEGYITSWNLGGERIKGYKPHEIIGKHYSTFYTSEDVHAGRPLKNLQNALKNGRTEDEGWRVRKDGSRFWADCIITTLRDGDGKHVGFAKITRDLTERKKSEDTRRVLIEEQIARAHAEASQKKITAVLNTLTDAYVSFDKDWTITFANPEAMKITGLSSNEMLGKSHWSLFPATVGTVVEREYKRAVQERKPIEFENYYEPFSKWFAIKALPTDEGLSVFFRDITFQKHSEAQNSGRI